ncbi:MAG: prolyl oligopeptidase family serine peptidase [Anaerolineales bacterium]|nr:prolyl oligopeptidase family serine peptidase [Anaerolineales bacterium]
MDILTRLMLLIFLATLAYAGYRYFQRTPHRPGTYKRTLQPGGHRYGLFIPEVYRTGKSLPLVVVLHYGGHGGAYYGYEMMLDLVLPAYADLGAFLVAPDCPAVNWEREASQEVIQRLIDYLVAEYQVNPKQVAICGYSLGGIGVWHSLRHHPERYTAGVIISSLPPVDALEVDWQVPMYVIHSRADELMPLQSTLTVVHQLQKTNLEVRLMVIENFGHYDTRRFITPLRETAFWLQDIWKKL